MSILAEYNKMMRVGQYVALTFPVLATWSIRSKTSVSVMALALTSPTYNT